MISQKTYSTVGLKRKVRDIEPKPVRLYCEHCHKEEFEGFVYGRYVSRRLTSSYRGVVCNHCSGK